jgi:hypothetical protein
LVHSPRGRRAAEKLLLKLIRRQAIGVKRVPTGVDEDDFGVLDRGTAQDGFIGYGGPVAGVDADAVDLDRALGGRELRVTTETKRIFGRRTGLERRAENAGVGTDRQGVAVHFESTRQGNEPPDRSPFGKDLAPQCSASVPVRQFVGLHVGRISGSS